MMSQDVRNLIKKMVIKKIMLNSTSKGKLEMGDGDTYQLYETVHQNWVSQLINEVVES